jgi:hypothetical protein
MMIDEDQRFSQATTLSSRYRHPKRLTNESYIVHNDNERLLERLMEEAATDDTESRTTENRKEQPLYNGGEHLSMVIFPAARCEQ